VVSNIDQPIKKDTENTTKENQEEISDIKIWDAIVKNYEIIQGAQISNSFIILMILNEANQPLTTTKISELISKRSKGYIYKISSTVRDSLEYRLKREGYVKSVDIKGKSLYSITMKGRKLLEGWIAFISAY
jgi:predicted transcriptional regulator